MSSQPVRLMTLLAGLMYTCQVARKSAAVTSLPSLHSASGLYVKRMVSGLFFTIVGLPVHRRGTHCAVSLRIWQPYQMLLMTMLVAYRLLPTHGPWRLGGSCSWMKTTVPADARSVPAVAPGPMARLATSTSPASSQSERLRMCLSPSSSGTGQQHALQP